MDLASTLHRGLLVGKAFRQDEVTFSCLHRDVFTLWSPPHVSDNTNRYARLYTAATKGTRWRQDGIHSPPSKHLVNVTKVTLLD